MLIDDDQNLFPSDDQTGLLLFFFLSFVCVVTIMAQMLFLNMSFFCFVLFLDFLEKFHFASVSFSFCLLDIFQVCHL